MMIETNNFDKHAEDLFHFPVHNVIKNCILIRISSRFHNAIELMPMKHNEVIQTKDEEAQKKVV